ncbi:hypothetical protein F4818DRAFT_404127 [Hypoxylon cercidicola]|nr:hypothetical protein F4818DRAFT_404127 [Hypoxylon cercidicola]
MAHCLSYALTTVEMPPSYISGLQVVYSDSNIPPADSIPEINIGKADINYEFGGKYVWLVPQWTHDPTDACTWLGVDVTSSARPDVEDLAKDTGGDYRYLASRKEEHLEPKIRNVALWRNSNGKGPMNQEDLKILEFQGYNGFSTDINLNRGKSYLYLIWAK